MFDLYGQNRLAEWRRFREKLESSETPLGDVAEFWSKAPFVSDYLDPHNPEEWPDPWHLILDDNLDDLAIVLGMCYTLKLTERFKDSLFEIHKHTAPDKKMHPKFYLMVDKTHVLNLFYRDIASVDDLSKVPTNLIWTQNKS